MIDCRLYISSWKKKLFFIFVNTLGTGISRKCCENSSMCKRKMAKNEEMSCSICLTPIYKPEFSRYFWKLLFLPPSKPPWNVLALHEIFLLYLFLFSLLVWIYNNMSPCAYLVWNSFSNLFVLNDCCLNIKQ